MIRIAEVGLATGSFPPGITSSNVLAGLMAINQSFDNCTQDNDCLVP